MTGAILIGLGFSPLAASGLSLIANTAPVAYGALGTPIAGLASVTGIDPFLLGAMVGRQLPFFSLIVPFWLIWAFAGWRGMMQVWPAILVCGVSFAIPQFLISNFINPWIVDIGASLISMACLIGFLKVWHPQELWLSPALRTHDEFRRDHAAAPAAAPAADDPQKSGSALLPWIIVCVMLLIWGTERVQGRRQPVRDLELSGPRLHNMINKVAPVVPKPTPEGAVFSFTWLSYTGSGMLIAAIISGFVMGFSPWRTDRRIRRARSRSAPIRSSPSRRCWRSARSPGSPASTRRSASLSPATGVLYPFFGTLLGWLGVALTGSDTASNVLFGNLQKITSEQLGLSPILMGAANSSGGVMGKMIDAQSIVVASTATNWFGHEGTILRFVFWHSIALACLVGLLVMLQAYVFTGMIVH